MERSRPELTEYVRGLNGSIWTEIATSALDRPVARVLLSNVEHRDGRVFGCFTGDKAVVRLTCEATTGDRQDIEVYVKRQESDKGYKETDHYLYLNSNGMGVLLGLGWWINAATNGIDSLEEEGRAMCQERLERSLTHLLRSLS